MDIKKPRFTIGIKLLLLILMVTHIADMKVTTSTESYHYPNPTNEQLMQSLEGFVQYFENNYKSFIFGAYYGLVRCGEYVKATLDDYYRGLSILNVQQLNRIKQIHKRIIDVSKKIQPILAKNSQSYRQLHKLTQTPITVPEGLVSLNFTELHHVVLHDGSPESKNWENISDSYLHMISGSGNYQVCTITNTSWADITNYHTDGYIITHQMLNILTGQQFNCTEKMDKLAKDLGGIKKVTEVLCTQIYNEMQQELKKSLAFVPLQDLFLEQMYTCGAWGGYREFLNMEYLSMFLNWQTTAGCIAAYYGPFVSLHPNMTKDYTEDDSRYLFASDQLLIDKTITGDCDQHTTAIGMSLVAAFLHLGSLKNQPLYLHTPKTSAIPAHNRTYLTFIILGVIIGIIVIIVMLMVFLKVYSRYSLRNKEYAYQKVKNKE
ncbi:UPF0764 protein C16orf89-like protein [Trichoplax sp. H2]|nr:UPF0764 protein C16orf89-like protein [Trichoplax sp. H2]|eukprot:RDD37308.1 UPF0764 protein C16orf89-like protein [Trichoplax sp. H2]